MDNGLLPGTLEWWHVVLSIIGIVVTFAMRWFGQAFQRWADKLDSFQNTVDKRLTHMEKDFATRMGHIEGKFNRHEDRVQNLTLHVEKRVTWIEATLKNAPYLPEATRPQRRWYERPADETGTHPVMKRRSKSEPEDD